MKFTSAFNLAGLSEDDALTVAKDKRDAALKKLNEAQAEFFEWDKTHARLLAAWANKHYGQPPSNSERTNEEPDEGDRLKSQPLKSSDPSL
jgi:hypothetical protein